MFLHQKIALGRTGALYFSEKLNEMYENLFKRIPSAHINV
jgi:hypothetical protein